MSTKRKTPATNGPEEAPRLKTGRTAADTLNPDPHAINLKLLPADHAHSDNEVKMTPLDELKGSLDGLPSSPLNSIISSVVKIFCTATRPNFSLPWQMHRQEISTSSGFIIAGRRIICNAHGVAYHSVVRVRKHGGSHKFIAKVLHVAHECDLAVLTVEGDRAEEFWSGLTPLELGGVPNLQDEVICVGYPTGGDNISVTQGIVSRVAMGKYSHSDEELLCVQIDAAINSGNSGGPALRGNKVVGVAFETLDEAENIGYIIPCTVIEHLLTDIERHGKHQGFCTADIAWQPLENQSMREALSVPVEDKDKGVLITRTRPLTDAARALQRDDVLVALDGVAIGSDGTVKFRGDERVSFLWLICEKYVGDTVTATIFRNKQKMEVKFRLGCAKPLVRIHMYDTPPSYFIYGGLVFTVLSVPLLASEYGCKWDKKAPVKLCERAFFGIPTKENQEVVIMNQVLVADINIGYEDIVNMQVKKVNGEEVLNLKHLATLIRENKQPYLRIDMELGDEAVVVLNCEKAEKSTAEVLKQNNIPSAMSRDLVEPQA